MGRHSDSDEERPKPKRQKRFTFRTFEQRVSNVRQAVCCHHQACHVMSRRRLHAYPTPLLSCWRCWERCADPLPAGQHMHAAAGTRPPPAAAAATACCLSLTPLSSYPWSSPRHCVQVEVDVYRSLGPKRAEPLPGSTSFFQEGLNKWRELNSAEHWLAAASALSPLCQTLPLLVHHREEVLGVLLGGLRMEAALSLEPLLELIGTLARDLQADFLPALDSVLTALADLVDEGERILQRPGSSWCCPEDDAVPGWPRGWHCSQWLVASA